MDVMHKCNLSQNLKTNLYVIQLNQCVIVLIGETCTEWKDTMSHACIDDKREIRKVHFFKHIKLERYSAPNISITTCSFRKLRACAVISLQGILFFTCTKFSGK